MVVKMDRQVDKRKSCEERPFDYSVTKDNKLMIY